MTTTPAESGDRGKGLARAAKLGAVALGVLLLVLLGRQAGTQVYAFAQWVQGLGVWGPVVFVAGYAAAVVAFVPGSVLTLGAGAIFGLAAGTVYVFGAATLGACAAFLIARYAARGWVEQRLAGNQRFAAIDRAINQLT